MQNVIELHKSDLKAGHAKLATLQAQSNEWWEIKERLKKYEIAYSQAANLANDMVSRNLTGGKNSISIKEYMEAAGTAHLEFYQHLTAPYRPEKKLPEGIANIDDEINLEKND